MEISNPWPEKVQFFNLNVNVLDRKELFSTLRQYLSTTSQISINFLNFHCFNIAQKDAEYRHALRNCTLLLNDGVGIDIAGKLIGVDFKENLNGTDFIPELFDFFAVSGMSVFCFGAKKEVIENAVRKIEINHPGLTIVGYSDGYINDPTSVIDQINTSNADAVILGLGVPLQEIWVDKYSHDVKTARVFVSGGAIFDFISGNVMRAPLFMRRVKLEWLFRLIQEPTRLFSRYVLGSLVFLYHIVVLRK